MESPVFYIVSAMMFASLTLSVIFFLAWKTQGNRPYALSWSIAFLAATGQWFLNLQRDLFSTHATYWLAVNALALIVITLGIRGHCQRTDCQRLPSNLWPYVVVIFAGVVWTSVVKPHVGISMALTPTYASITLLLSALLIVRHREFPRPAEWAAATALLLFGVAQGMAASMALMQGALGDADYLALYMHFNFLTLPSGYMATGMFTIFMLASDLSEQMREIAVNDQLTGVLNRRGLTDRGAVSFATARRNNLPLSIVMTDIDRFKTINDGFGHSTGDGALVHFADLLKYGRRAEDILARVGGEEFAIVLPGASLEAALLVADELCARVDATPMRVDGVEVRMTASFGVAAVSSNDESLSDTMIRADRALYRSKRAGRNQVDLESSQLMLAADGTLKPLIA